MWQHLKEHHRNHWHMSWFWVSARYAELYPWWNPRRYKAGGYLNEMWYFLRCAAWNRYNVVTIPTLPPTWNEWDTRLLHGMMAIFCDYVEKSGDQRWTPEDLRKALEQPDDGFSHGWHRGHMHIAEETEALYKWWKVDRPARLAAESKALDDWHDVFMAAGGLKFEHSDSPQLNRLVFPNSTEVDRLYKAMNDMELAGDAEDEAMLIRLVKIRRSMWT